MNKFLLIALLFSAHLHLGALALPVAEENAEALIQEDFPLVERKEANAANDVAPIPDAKDGNAPGVAKWSNGGGHGGGGYGGGHGGYGGGGHGGYGGGHGGYGGGHGGYGGGGHGGGKGGYGGGHGGGYGGGHGGGHGGGYGGGGHGGGHH